MQRIAPGPKGIPFFGSVFPAWRDPLGLMLGAREEHGDVVRFKFGPFDYYLVADPDVVKHVLVDNAKSYTKSRNYQGLKLVLGSGLLTSEGDYWRRQRKLAQPAFHRDRLEGFARTMAGATRAMLARWESEPSDAPFCIHTAMMHLTFRVVGLTLFSADVDGDASEVGVALDTALRWANEYAESMIRIPPYLPTPNNLRFKKAMKTLDAVVHRIIAERRASSSCGNDLLGMLMSSVEEGSDRGMSDQELRDEVITMVLAGHETTANLLSWTFYLLSKHPEIERRVREEATRVLGDRDPTLADMKSLEYARMVLDEALRLYPPAWIFERQTIVDDELGGFFVKKGSIVGISPYVLHRHPRYWENPEGFDPERFRNKDASRPRWSYLPFGGGPRMCIGNHFAMMEAQIMIAMIVRAYRLELDPSHTVIVDPLITLRPKHGVRVRRKSSSPAATESSRYPARRIPNEPPAAFS